MDSHKLFWEAFGDEMSKDAGIADLLMRGAGAAGKLVGKGISEARPLVQSGMQALVKSPVGQFVAKRPALGKALGFAGTQLAVGAAGTAAEIPFRARKQVIRVVPGPDQQPQYGPRPGVMGAYNQMGGY